MSGEELDLMALAQQVVKRTEELGAQEVSVSISRGSHVSIQRREGKVEQATEATTRGLVVSLLANDRYTSNATSDLRPEALDHFLKRCVDAARWLEPDPNRRLADRAATGRGVSEATLDQDDPTWRTRTASERGAWCESLESAVLARSGPDRISSSAWVGDGRSEAVRVLSNGFADRTAGAWFSIGADLTLAEGDKRPEGGAHYAARHLTDLPSVERISEEVVSRARERIGSRPIASGKYPMLLENRTAGRVLGLLAGPLSGSALHEGRSCLADRLGTRIASPLLDIVDDPTLPRGMASRPWDGDCLVARPRTVIEDGVLRTYYVGLYHSRKMGVEPTTAGRSNWVVRPGTRPYDQIAADLDRCIVVTSFLGGSSNAATGDFSFGIRGLLLEKGQVVQSLAEMNVTGNLLQLMEQLVEVGNDPWTFASTRSPSMLWQDVQFSGL
ncbi:MAG: TldD/PmbA family protein [Alphaproteobacteria bacterium]|nr:TldD/PmbA family protein [Alphaproteobacteria bacterium]MCB9698979.1 TldD/PmbA family protein [Alphaproteobacteria bacterium]